MSDKLPLFERSANHKGSTAIIDSVGSFTYNQLMDASARVGSALLGGASDLAERRIAFLTQRHNGAFGEPVEWPSRWPFPTRRRNWNT